MEEKYFHSKFKTSKVTSKACTERNRCREHQDKYLSGWKLHVYDIYPQFSKLEAKSKETFKKYFHKTLFNFEIA